jgi:hypothetical protein
MIELLMATIAVAASTGIGAGVYFKLGRLETKLNFLYENCDIVITFKKKDNAGP